MQSEYICPHCGGESTIWGDNRSVCRQCLNPVEETLPDVTGGLPAEMTRKGFEKAPATITGLTVGGILGALVGGPVGAFIGGAFGGWLGLNKDEDRSRY